MKKKCLVIGYMNLNLGDDIFFDILFRRYKDVEFYFFPPSVLLKKYQNLFGKYKNVIMYENHEEYIRIRKDITDENVPINLFPMICECCKEVDFYINIGGSIFRQYPQWLNDDRFILKDILKDKPSFIIGCNFGPGDKSYYNYYQEWFKKFDDVCFRDKESYKRFSKLPNTRLADDILLMQKKFPLSKLYRHSVGISLVSPLKQGKSKKTHESYVKFHLDIIKKYIKEKYHINLFAFASEEHDGDTEVINEICKKLTDEEKNYVTIHTYEGNIKEFLRKFRKNKYIIGGRFHSIILAITNHQEFIPISYSNKLDNVLKDIDRSIKVIPIDEDMKGKSIKRYYKVNKKFTSEKHFEKIDQYIKQK